MRTLVISAVLALAVPALALATAQSMSPVVSAKLKGVSEAGVKGDPNGSGLAVVHLSTAKGTACWQFSAVKNIAKPLQAHIHKGSKGVSGPIVIPFGKSYKAKGCVRASKSIIEKIETNPSAYYVNIHNSQYPAGAIRGQLVVGMHG
jgi:CHRD domain